MKSQRIRLDGWLVNKKMTCFTHAKTNYQIRISYHREFDSTYIGLFDDKGKKLNKQYSNIVDAIDKASKYLEIKNNGN